MIAPRTYDHRDGYNGSTILIVDDEEIVRSNLTTVCREIEGHRSLRILTASSLSAAFDELASNAVNVVLLDKNLKRSDGEDDGIDAIPQMLQLRPQLQILIVSGSRDSQDIVRAMKYGAFGFVTKGVDDELLPAQIGKAIEVSHLTLDKTRFEKGGMCGEVCEVVGISPAASRLRALVPQLAETDGPVLLLGETGTGKTTLAKQIHRYRRDYLKQQQRPFFYVNIASLSPSLVERELFGSEPGSYTGAPKATHQGFFELANTGTLFLDEIGDISPEVQSKLLEVLQEGTFYRVGGTKKIATSFKLICATNKNLFDLVKRKAFREDLYWRIAALPIELPALAERKEDIPELIRELLPNIARRSRVPVGFDGLPKDFIEYLTKNPPEGNLRGLEQKLAQLLTLAPRDKKGNRLLHLWKKVPDLGRQTAAKKTNNVVKDILSAQIDTSSPDFPGLPGFVGTLERKILMDARSRFKKNKDIAKALKISEGSASLRMKALEPKTQGVVNES